MNKYVFLIPLLPLIGFLINGLGRNFLSRTLVGIIGSGVLIASFVIRCYRDWETDRKSTRLNSSH